MSFGTILYVPNFLGHPVVQCFLLHLGNAPRKSPPELGWRFPICDFMIKWGKATPRKRAKEYKFVAARTAAAAVCLLLQQHSPLGVQNLLAPSLFSFPSLYQICTGLLKSMQRLGISTVQLHVINGHVPENLFNTLLHFSILMRFVTT